MIATTTGSIRRWSVRSWRQDESSVQTILKATLDPLPWTSLKSCRTVSTSSRSETARSFGSLERSSGNRPTLARVLRTNQRRTAFPERALREPLVDRSNPVRRARSIGHEYCPLSCAPRSPRRSACRRHRARRSWHPAPRGTHGGVVEATRRRLRRAATTAGSSATCVATSQRDRPYETEECR